MWEWIAEFFRAITSAAEVAKTYAPTDAMKEKRFDRQIPRKSVDEREKMLKKAIRYLTFHPFQSVDAYVDFCIDDVLNEEDEQELRDALYEHPRFKKRKHIKQD
jgi:hypothetical protein